MPAGNLGPEEVVTTDPDETLHDVAGTLETEDVGAVVVTEDDEPVGVVTDRDVALAIPDSDDITSREAREIMSEDPATLQEDAEGIEISRVIDQEDVRRIPIVDDAGKLTGIVTLDDLVATIGEQLDNVADTIEGQSPEYSP